MIEDYNFLITDSVGIGKVDSFTQNYKGIVNVVLTVQCSALSEIVTATDNSNEQLWTLKVDEKTSWSDELKTYSDLGVENILSKMNCLMQNSADPSSFFVICSYKLNNETDVANYITSELTKKGYYSRNFL